MGDGGDGGNKDGGNVMGVRDDLQGIHAVGILYGSNNWVVMGSTLKVLEVLHHWAARWIVGMTAQNIMGGEWEFPTVPDALETARLCPIK